MLKKMLMQMEQAGEEGGAWLASLPEDIRTNPSLTKFKDPVALAKSYVEAQSLLGNSLRPPGADASAEAKAEFRKKLIEKVPDLVYLPTGDAEAEAELWKRLGRPGKPEEYDVDPALKDEGVNVDELRALAANAGLTKAQFKALASQYAEGQKAGKLATSEAMKALKTEWGAAYEERVLSAKTAALKMGVSEADLANLTPKELRIFAQVAKATGAPAAPFGREAGIPAGRLTPLEAQAEMADIRGNPDYWSDGANPSKQKALIARMVELTPMAYPE